MLRTKTARLQFFAEELRETGVNPADAGQESESAPGQEQPGTQTQGTRMSWEEILADPEYKSAYDSQVQAIIQKRLRARAEAEERLGRLSPVLEAIGRRYGTGEDLMQCDLEELAQTILYGESRIERERRRAGLQEHLAALLEQERAMRELYPGFDLEREMEDRRFVRLTAPETGLTLEQAYCALHHRQLGEETARRSLKAATDTVRAGRMRPRELPGGQAASSQKSDPRNMSREEREELKKRIYDAKAQGKKLPYGG